MSHNTVFEELYSAREKLLADAGGDAHKYLEGVRERERASGRLLSDEELRAIRGGRVAKSDELAVENFSSPPGERERNAS